MALIISASCAKRVAPTGGDKDDTPPKVLGSLPPNGSTNMQGQSIILRFDEYIQLQNARQQIILSPLTDQKPDIRIKGKSVIIKFPEALTANTSYNINFGESIKDITEGNPLGNFVYAFSTGSVLDSLSVKGKLVVASSNLAAPNINVALYPALSDTLFTSTPPHYITRSNEKGLFSLSNLAAGTYQLVALSDKNNNYYFDQANEEIAFFPSFITVPPTDSSTVGYELRLFEEAAAQPKLLEKRNREHGHIALIFSKGRDSLQVKVLDAAVADTSLLIETNAANDTAHIWYKHTQEQQSINLVLRGSNNFVDTVKFKRTIRSNSLQPLRYSTNIKTGRTNSYMDLKQKIWIQFNHPILKIDLNRLQILAGSDSTDIKADTQIYLDKNLSSRLYLDYDWQAGTRYLINFPDSTLYDFQDLYSDEFAFDFKTYEQKDYGTILVKLPGYDATNQYILQLSNSKGELKKQVILTQESNQINLVKAGQYLVSVVEDTNNNGKWDTGEYASQQQPEMVFGYKSEVIVRENWDTELSIDVSPLP